MIYNYSVLRRFRITQAARPCPLRVLVRVPTSRGVSMAAYPIHKRSGIRESRAPRRWTKRRKSERRTDGQRQEEQTARVRSTQRRREEGICWLGPLRVDFFVMGQPVTCVICMKLPCDWAARAILSGAIDHQVLSHVIRHARRRRRTALDPSPRTTST